MIKRFCDICGAEVQEDRYRSVRLLFGGETHCNKGEVCDACVDKIKETFNAVISDLRGEALKGDER